MPDPSPDPKLAAEAAAGTPAAEPTVTPQSVSSTGHLGADFRTWLDEHDAHQLRFWSTDDTFSVYCRTCEGGTEGDRPHEAR